MSVLMAKILPSQLSSRSAFWKLQNAFSSWIRIEFSVSPFVFYTVSVGEMPPNLFGKEWKP